MVKENQNAQGQYAMDLRITLVSFHKIHQLVIGKAKRACEIKRKPDTPRYIVDGFVFHVNIMKGNPPMTYLRCMEYKRLGCHARAVIPYNGTVQDILIKKPHNHPPDYIAEEKILFIRELKDFMLQNKTLTSREVYDIFSPIYPNAARETTFESMRSKMNRWRRSSEPVQSGSLIIIKDASS